MYVDANPIPAAFLVGAPKCGTTAVAQLLAEHPLVQFSRNKEPCFFCTDLTGKVDRPASIGDYVEREFGPALPDGRLRIEASVTSLSSKVAIPEILKVRPDARFVAMIREPVQMACSLHAQMVHSGLQPTVDLNQAWIDRKKLAAKGSRWNPRCAWLDYEAACSLGDQITLLLATAPSDQVLILSQHHLHQQSMVDQLMEFLALETGPDVKLARVNTRKGRPRWGWVSRSVTRLSYSSPVGVARNAVRKLTPFRGFGGLSERVRRACMQETQLDAPTPETLKDMQQIFEPQRIQLDRLSPGWNSPTR